jgi:hypothetical protein
MQGLGFTRIKGILKSFTLIGEAHLISPELCAHPILAKNYNHQIHKVILQICIHNSFLQRYKQNSNNMLKLRIYERAGSSHSSRF